MIKSWGCPVLLVVHRIDDLEISHIISNCRIIVVHRIDDLEMADL